MGAKCQEAECSQTRHRLHRAEERLQTARALSLRLHDDLGRSGVPAPLLELSQRLAEVLTERHNFDPETGKPL